MFSDVRFAVRQLAAAKGFTVTATLTLALGIGANTGIFTLIHAVMVKSPPVADPQRIIRLGDGENCCVLGAYQNRADYTIVGYVNTIRFRDPRRPGRPMFFLPLLQMKKSDWENNAKARSNLINSINLRVSGNPADLAPKSSGRLAPSIPI